MWKAKLYRTAAWLLTVLSPGVVNAAGDMTAQTPIEVTLSLGDMQDALRFVPARLSFETGRLYKLVLHNPSRQKHYFSANSLARAVFTRKVQVLNPAQQTVVEVKGRIDEIEVYPGATAEWWFVPVKTLRAAPFHCSITGHAAAGMTGSIDIH